MIKKSLPLAILTLLVLSLFLPLGCGSSETDEGTGEPAEERPTDTRPPVISDLTDAEVTATTAKITWTTDEPATSQVEYGATDAYGSETSLDTELSTTHSVTLQNLAQDTEYHFRAKSKDKADNESLSRDKDFKTELAQPDFSISDLSLSHDRITVWQQADVIATAEVTNTGEADGIYTAIWKVDGDEVEGEERDEFDIAAGTTKEITMTFEIMKTTGPSCEIGIGGETAILTVEEGVLTPLSAGDSWRFETSLPTGLLGTTIKVEVTAEVIGEEPLDENNCYVLELSTEDDRFIEFEGTMRIDKGTMLPVEMEARGEYASIYGPHPFEIHGTYSFKFLKEGEERFPLVVGKEFKVEETVVVEGTGYEGTQTTTETYLYRVEAIEDVRVDAGTFRCFRIVKYDDAGTIVVGTGWVSDEVKQWPVKMESEDNSGDLWGTTQLISYSLSAAP
jgi:hypothetical protein